MQGNAADELCVEVPLADGAARRLANRREGLRQQLVERLSGCEALAEAIGPDAQVLIGQPLEISCKGVGMGDARPLRAQQPLVSAAEKPGKDVPQGTGSSGTAAGASASPVWGGLKTRETRYCTGFVARSEPEG